MIPTTFYDWKNCIENNCKINLTKEFAQQRLNIYEDSENQETQKFIKIYGEAHLQNVINWFKQI